ncbi:MAG: nuclear transport factor 2 family protein [Bacteroidetes bacterium]|nr:nuclear transport factor 2 family protein [Bacteroidota bacterium]
MTRFVERIRRAVVTGISVQSGISNGQPWQGRFRFTRIWVMRSGAWVMVSSHSLRIAEGK